MTVDWLASIRMTGLEKIIKSVFCRYGKIDISLRLILCQINQKKVKCNPPSQILMKFLYVIEKVILSKLIPVFAKSIE